MLFATAALEPNGQPPERQRADHEAKVAQRDVVVARVGEQVERVLRDERIDVRDLALAVDCYREVATELLG